MGTNIFLSPKALSENFRAKSGSKVHNHRLQKDIELLLSITHRERERKRGRAKRNETEAKSELIHVA